MYEVMLDVPETVSLLSAVSERLTGSGYTDAEKESLTKELSTLSTQ